MLEISRDREGEELINNIKIGLLKHFAEKKPVISIFLETKFIDLNIIDCFKGNEETINLNDIQDLSRRYLKKAIKEMFDSEKIPEGVTFIDLLKLFKLSFKLFKKSDDYN